ncbi:hypothetical protein E4U61_004940 [Claviceps capensis]|nr:hypothetical protein E4U61_004940 [Claviceps capensis]
MAEVAVPPVAYGVNVSAQQQPLHASQPPRLEIGLPRPHPKLNQPASHRFHSWLSSRSRSNRRDSKRKKSGENRFSGAFPSECAASADPITIDDDTESDCGLQKKEVNLENIETMKVEEDDSDSEDEGSRPASPSTTADVRLARSAGVLSTRLRRAAWFRRRSVEVVWQEERGLWQDV